MLFVGFLMLVPLFVLPFYPSEWKYAVSFLVPALISILLGTVFCHTIRHSDDRMVEGHFPMQKGSVPVLFAWCYGIVIGAIPFLMTNQLDFTHALFESVSGWTTTGLTVVDVTKTPQIFLFHRSFMQYCGGLGFVMMMLMLVQGKQAMHLYSAEGHPDRIMPNLKKTVRTIFLLYNGFLTLGAIAYFLLGMPMFDSICHSMSALSTAGFSTQPGSIGQYESFSIEIVTILLMLIGSTNFAVLLMITRFKMKRILQISEMKFLGGLLLVFVPLCALALSKGFGMGVLESLHESLFGVVTVFSTTGYSTMDYATWPPFSVGLLILLMIIGGGMGSTAGGIKLSRAYLLIRITRENIRKRFSPSRNVTAPYYYRPNGRVPIDGHVISETFGFVSCYIGIFIIGTLVLTLLEDCSLETAIYEFASAFGTVGISNGLIESAKHGLTLWVEMFAMLLGRLEIFIIFVGIYTSILGIKNKVQNVFSSNHK